MSTSPEFEASARQDYGSASPSENEFEQVMDEQLSENMNVQSIRTPVLRALPISPNEGTAEPDSTDPEALISSQSKLEQDTEYEIVEKQCDTEMAAVDTLSGIVRIEEATIDSAGRITYPIVQAANELTETSFMDSAGATLIQTPLNTTIVQNVTKLPQNFTINVDATVGNITAIQNVTQDVTGNQTLWLPTILATSAAPADDKLEEDIPPSGVSQIIITSESYVSDATQAGRRANIVTDTGYVTNRPKTPKVQILSNIAVPKSAAFPQQFLTQSKDLGGTPVYATQNHVYKLGTNILPQKHLNSTVLCSKSSKNQMLMSTLNTSMVNTTPMKNVTYSHTFTKSTNVKTINKINNGAAAVNSTGNTQCHILSRVVSGPNKLSVHSGRKTGTLKGKGSGQASGQKNHSRAIKIIQQSGANHKSDKGWTTGVSSIKTQTSTYDSNTSKVIQKVGSPPHKSQALMPVGKLQQKGERLILQSPCGPVLLTTAPSGPCIPKTPQYVQSGSTPNLRYVQTYGSPDAQISISQVSANQQLTAQILQSLSHPKLMLPPASNIIHHTLAPLHSEDTNELNKQANRKRVVVGDKSTLITADDMIGREERPNLAEELQRYTFTSLAFVMRDHTYALPAQKQPSPTTTSSTVAICTPVISSPVENPVPLSPVKQTSPVIMSTTPYDLPLALTPTNVLGPTIPVSAIAMGALQYKPQIPPPQEDDAVSNISSIEGERRPDRGGSDTETAPEGEEEGKTRCICDFTHDDGYMICCDRCGEWQHVDCMGIDRNNIPDQYLCDLCHPRPIDRRHARAIQLRKREELHALAGSDSDFSDGGRPGIPGQRKKRLLTVTTYSNTSSTYSSTAFNSSLPVLPPVPLPTLATKRGPKRPKKPENFRKGNKRKLSEKKIKRKKEVMVKNKYSSNVTSPTNFQESYELAMTNHYSPELRAKMTKYTSKMGNTANMAAALTAHLCTTVPHAGGKILIATKDLRESVPIIELRGKYMLSNQHKPQMQNSARSGSQKPGPFVFFYQLPKDNTQICIDTRTYGNEARFVRRSCKPNSELQHCIVKGTLHVYLVTTAIIPADTEITVGHDSEGVKQQCACGNPRYCKLNGLNSVAGRKSIDYPIREKRLSRNRCASISSPTSPPPIPALMSPVRDPIPLASPIKSEKKSPIKQELVSTPMSPPAKPAAVVALNFDEPLKAEISEIKPEIDLLAKEELKPEIDEPDSVKLEPLAEVKQNEVETNKPPKIETEPVKEEKVVPKEEPVIKEVEEKEVQPIKEEEEEPEEPEQSDEEKPLKPVTRKSKEIETSVSEDRPVTREMAARSAVHDRSTRTSRAAVCNPDSIDDKTDDSQEKLPSDNKKEEKKMTREERKMEAIMKAFERMEKAQQRKQEVKERQKRRESDPHPPGNEKEDDDDAHCIKKRRRRKGRARTTSQSNRRRLNSADSDMVTSGDEAPLTPRTPRRNASLNASAERNSDLPSEEFGLSSACRLVEAAVGSVESAFKLPKTKKAMASEWVGRSPDRTPSPYRSPYRPSLVPATSLESLVRVASTMIGDLGGGQTDDDNAITSPPRTPGKDKGRTPKKFKKVLRSTPPVVAEVVPATVPQHSAKKRWLRQAISEESDFPNAESPPNEMVTPLKKRRLARESLSCEQNNTAPCNEEASPRLTSDDSPVKDDSARHVRNIMDNIYARDRTQSDSGQGSDDQNMDNDVLNVNLKVPHDTEKIRRIIGIPTPEEELPPLPKSEPENTNNNSIQPEESSYNKVIPMDIDNTVTAQPKIESNENSCEMKVDSPIVIQSAETSGNSSPQRDEMDDIQKKIHSFHTENILMLKSRNKKPKEKRKKVNLNFDLNMVDDQISIQLRKDEATSPEVNGDIILVSPENIPLPSVETIPLPAPENIPLPEEPNLPLIPPPEAIPLPDEAIEPVAPRPVSPPQCLKPAAEKPENVVSIKEPMMTRSFTLRSESLAKAAAAEAKPLNFKKVEVPEKSDVSGTSPSDVGKVEEQLVSADKPSVLETLPFANRFSSSGLFSTFNSQTFNMDSAINENVPNMSIIKSAIDRTTTLDSSIFDKASITSCDELKNVQEILTRVNNMDSNNSLLLSGVLQSSNTSGLLESPSKSSGSKLFCQRSNDPRLNPPLEDKPKPVRRKLSISEYRKRLHKPTAQTEQSESQTNTSSVCSENHPEWSSSSGGASMSPQRLDAVAIAAQTELELRLHKELASVGAPKATFDAQPTASERQRENLSSRLRREFGLVIPEEDHHPPPDLSDDMDPVKFCDR